MCACLGHHSSLVCTEFVFEGSTSPVLGGSHYLSWLRNQHKLWWENGSWVRPLALVNVFSILIFTVS